MSSHDNGFDQPRPMSSSIWAGILGRCPRCHRGKQFSGLLRIAPKCNVCDLSYSYADSGDGPAVFVMLFAGFLIVGLALTIEVLYEPPYWVYLVVFLPLTIVVCLGLLRPLKGIMLQLQYRNKAEQGRLDSRSSNING